jgi:hypothetical protein
LVVNHSSLHRVFQAVTLTYVVAVWLASSGWAQQSTVELQSVAGAKVNGTIVRIEADRVSLVTTSGPLDFDFEKINSISFGTKSKALTDTQTKIQLVDGSVLHASSISIESGKLRANLPSGVALSVPTRDIEFVQLKAYGNDLELRRQWRDILDDDSREGDAIVVNREDALNSIEGIVGDLSQDKLSFSIEDRTAQVSLDKLDAILFYHATGRELVSPVAQLILTDNSEILVQEIKWVDSELKAVAVCGANFDIKTTSIVRLNFSFGRDVWLSSMEPSTNDWQPLITSPAIVDKLRRMKLARSNESFSGQPLSLVFSAANGSSLMGQTRQFETGFAIQSGGKLAFSLDRRYQNLTGWVGFDPSANPSGNVLFKVLVDGKLSLEKELISRDMKNPLELNLDITDAERVVFEVDYHDGRSIGDQLHLVDLKVSR